MSTVVQAEIERSIKDNHNDACTTTNGQQNVLDVVRAQAATGSNSAATQASPISASSQGFNGSDNNSINNASIAQLTRGNGGGDDGDGNGGGSIIDIGNGSGRDGKGGGSRKYEFTLVNPRKIIINTFAGRNLHTTPYMPFNNTIRRFIVSQGPDGELLLHILDAIEALGNTKYTNEQ